MNHADVRRDDMMQELFNFMASHKHPIGDKLSISDAVFIEEFILARESTLQAENAELKQTIAEMVKVIREFINDNDRCLSVAIKTMINAISIAEVK